MYKVIHPFCDLRYDNHLYSVGDTFPVKGCRPTKARYAELSGSENKVGMPLIEEVTENKSSH